jgi:tRNA G18 (ribose-2'-O)-methylase SpoU
MNVVGYKYYDEAKTRRSAETLKMNKGEDLKSFQKRCKSLGFDPIDSRNLINPYKNLSDTIIKGDLNKRRFNFSVLLQNISHDFNKASVIRNNNAFTGQEIIIFGNKLDDIRGCCGAHKYENIKHVREISQLDGVFEEFDVIIGIDNIDGAKPIQSYTFQHNLKTLFVFGEEEIGLCGELLKKCDDILYIPQYGSVRSINVACASAIVMYEYTRNFIS